MRNLALIYIFLLFGSISVYSQSEDVLSPMRTNKKILTVEKASAPYYSIQILALQEPPQDPGYFKNIDIAKEFICNDGFVRYVVGEYRTFSEAAADLNLYNNKGYSGAFVVNTSKLGVQSSTFSSSAFKIDPNKQYMVQLSAFRFPVYLNYFEQVEKVLEFYMKDKIYRYCTDKIQGTSVESELKRYKELGFKDAFIVEFEKYKSFQIE